MKKIICGNTENKKMNILSDCLKFLLLWTIHFCLPAWKKIEKPRETL